jgi:hypothetical protein
MIWLAVAKKWITLAWQFREWIALGLLAAGLAYGGWHARGVVEDARATRAAQDAMVARVDAEQNSWTAGMNLETGLSDYRPAAQQIDRKVQDATTHDAGNRFDNGSVQRTAARISAGEAARQRIDPVR